MVTDGGVESRAGGSPGMEPRPDWWRTFFSGHAVDFWMAATTDDQTRMEADFLRDALGVAPPARLLDVPCGGGRHCRALSGMGYAMTGVDLSEEFLVAARSGDTGSSGRIAWEHREMRDLPWPAEFDGAYCVGNSFGYLADDENAEFLRSVAQAVRPGGRFVLETGYVAETLLPVLQADGRYEVGDILVLSKRSYLPATGRLHVEYTWLRNGVSEAKSMSARVYTYREVIGLLEAAGFGDIRGFGSMAGEPFELGSSQLVAVATKTKSKND